MEKGQLRQIVEVGRPSAQIGREDEPGLPSRTQDTCDLFEDKPGIEDVLEHVESDDDVKAFLGVWQRLSSTDVERDIRRIPAGGKLLTTLHHGGRDFDPYYLAGAAVLCVVDAAAAISAPEIQDASIGEAGGRQRPTEVPEEARAVLVFALSGGKRARRIGQLERLWSDERPEAAVLGHPNERAEQCRCGRPATLFAAGARARPTAEILSRLTSTSGQRSGGVRVRGPMDRHQHRWPKSRYRAAALAGANRGPLVRVVPSGARRRFVMVAPLHRCPGVRTVERDGAATCRR